MTKRTALISVYDKDGIADFARELISLGFTIYASGGTATHLAQSSIEVTDIAMLIGGEAILGHRVVTLSREVHAGLLARDIQEDLDELVHLGIPRIDLVCVDLYPLEEEIAKEGSTLESVIEKTDIGGPTMIRSAAKGQRIVICDPKDRHKVLDWLKSPDTEHVLPGALAAKGEFKVSRYCMASAAYRSHGEYAGIFGKQTAVCKYGENAHQAPAALFSSETEDPLALDKFALVEGAPLSYNNYCDLDRLLQTMTHIAAAFSANMGGVDCIAIGAKHGNACGCAVSDSEADAIKRMMSGDPDAIFGGLIMTNFTITAENAEHLTGKMLDGVFAPAITTEARDMLRRKGDKCRFVINPALKGIDIKSLDTSKRFRYVRGGFLQQPNYTFVPDLRREIHRSFDVKPLHEYKIYGGELTDGLIADMLLAWAIGSTSNSNTITLVRQGMLIGNGVGQQDRVGAAKLAIERAKRSKHDVFSAVAYSDSFFPFPDGPQTLIEAGVTAILTSSGSIKDQLTIDLCNQRGVRLCMIADKTCRGFFGH